MVVDNTGMCPLGEEKGGWGSSCDIGSKQVPPSIKIKQQKKVSSDCLPDFSETSFGSRDFFVYWRRVTRGEVESERRRRHYRWPRVKARRGSIVLPECSSASRASVFIQTSMGRWRVKTNRDFLDGRSARAAAPLFPRITGELIYLFIYFWDSSSQIISISYFRVSVMAAWSVNLMNLDED